MKDPHSDIIPPSPPLPWYTGGLHFKCTECGQCCTGSAGFVWVTKEEIEAMATSLGMPLDLFRRKYLRQQNNRSSLIEKKNDEGGYDCIFLKDKKCQIYQARPSQCRVFPWWKEHLNTEESWNLAALECEGINSEGAPLLCPNPHLL